MTIQAFCDRHDHKDLFRSTWWSSEPDPSAARNYALYFRVASKNLEQVRIAAGEVCSYVEDRFHAPDSVIDVSFNGGGSIPDASVTLPAGMVILIPPVVFDGRPTRLMPALNRDLAVQMNEEGLDVDVDCCAEQQQFIPLPNTFRSATGRFVIPLRVREALGISAKGILDLSRQPRPDDSFAQARRVAETSEWFAAALDKKQRRVRRQLQLREHLLRSGWVVPPCVKRLGWVALSEDQALEACRIVAGFYPFIGASAEEVGYQINRLNQRHGLQQAARLRAIVTWGQENPEFVGCSHPLLRPFCPAGKCLMTEMLNECQDALLFAPSASLLARQDATRRETVEGLTLEKGGAGHSPASGQHGA